MLIIIMAVQTIFTPFGQLSASDGEFRAIFINDTRRIFKWMPSIHRLPKAFSYLYISRFYHYPWSSTPPLPCCDVWATFPRHKISTSLCSSKTMATHHHHRLTIAIIVVMITMPCQLISVKLSLFSPSSSLFFLGHYLLSFGWVGRSRKECVRLKGNGE